MKKNNIFTVQVMKIKYILNGKQNTDCGMCVCCVIGLHLRMLGHNELLISPAD